MKKLLIYFCQIFLSINAGAQNDSISLSELEIPNSPAFVLLDEAPSAVERPTSSKAFALSILNSLDNSTGIPKNYAAEFTPFWFFKHPNMTALKYIGLDSTGFGKNVFNNMKKASISIALIDNVKRDSMLPIKNFSIGVRVNLISVWSKEDELDIRGRYKIAVSKRKKETLTILTPVPPLNLDTDKEAKALYEKEKMLYGKMKEFILDSLESLKSDLSEDLIARPIFAIDFAAGYNEFYLENDFSKNHFGRLGAWLTCNYSINFKHDKACYLNIYAAAKYLKDGTQFINDAYVKRDFFDAGGKLELECKKFCLSFEWLRRLNDDENSTRSNGVFKYKISNKLYLTGAFGKNFGKEDNLISLLGVNWGFSTGEEKVKLQ